MIAARDDTERPREPAALGNRLGGWLGFAAAPTFGAMAVLTFAAGGDADMMCSAMLGTSPLGGMAPMYVLMSAFHTAPWLKLISRR
jgi:hypothetical protein